jgi:acyl-coenzyme A thioesterase PaaI-like protein
METKHSFQEVYPPEFSYCYGCGCLNEHGLHIKSYWEDGEAICRYTPEKHHISIPGFVYGGLLASLIDCHCTGTASAITSKHEEGFADRYVTASLHVDYLKPTPLGTELVVSARIEEIKGRKVVLNAQLFANNELCVTGRVVVVKLQENPEN